VYLVPMRRRDNGAHSPVFPLQCGGWASGAIGPRRCQVQSFESNEIALDLPVTGTGRTPASLANHQVPT
jgi:hypothetical protein